MQRASRWNVELHPLEQVSSASHTFIAIQIRPLCDLLRTAGSIAKVQLSIPFSRNDARRKRRSRAETLSPPKAKHRIAGGGQWWKARSIVDRFALSPRGKSPSSHAELVLARLCYWNRGRGNDPSPPSPADGTCSRSKIQSTRFDLSGSCQCTSWLLTRGRRGKIDAHYHGSFLTWRGSCAGLRGVRASRRKHGQKRVRDSNSVVLALRIMADALPFRIYRETPRAR